MDRSGPVQRRAFRAPGQATAGPVGRHRVRGGGRV